VKLWLKITSITASMVETDIKQTVFYDRKS